MIYDQNVQQEQNPSMDQYPNGEADSHLYRPCQAAVGGAITGEPEDTTVDPLPERTQPQAGLDGAENGVGSGDPKDNAGGAALYPGRLATAYYQSGRGGNHPPL